MVKNKSGQYSLNEKKNNFDEIVSIGYLDIDTNIWYPMNIRGIDKYWDGRDAIFLEP